MNSQTRVVSGRRPVRKLFRDGEQYAYWTYARSKTRPSELKVAVIRPTVKVAAIRPTVKVAAIRPTVKVAVIRPTVVRPATVGEREHGGAKQMADTISCQEANVPCVAHGWAHGWSHGWSHISHRACPAEQNSQSQGQARSKVRQFVQVGRVCEREVVETETGAHVVHR